MPDFPPSSDMAKLLPLKDGILVWCLICDEELGEVHYLNQAIKLWTDHQEVKKAARHG